VLGFCPGAFAEYARTEADKVVPMPVSLTFEQAAAVPMAGATALRAIRDVVRCGPGTGCWSTGPRATSARTPCRSRRRWERRSPGVCSTGNVELVRSIGAAQVVDYTREDFTGGRACYDVILDNVCNRPLRRAVTPTGILVLNGGGSPGRVVGAVGTIVRAVVVKALVRERLRLVPHEQKRENLLTLTGLIEAGKLTPVLDRTYPLADTAEGVRHLERGHARGKVVITVA
jgi:NADPH:quinone reductase-like Zn-dependent oxidoreductase